MRLTTAGNLGIGDTGPDARLEILSTTEQLRLSYADGTDAQFTVSSGGDLTIAPSGSDFGITGNLDVSGTLTSGTSNAFTVGSTGQITSSFPNSALVLNGAGNIGVEHGRVDGSSSTAFYDFHSGATAVDYDVRLSVTGGTGSPGGGSLSILGAVGINDQSPDARLEVLSTAEQLRLTYTDDTIDTRFLVDSSGNLTLDASADGTGSETLTLTGFSTLTATDLTTVSFDNAALTVSSCTGCGGGADGTGPFQELNGAIVPNNSTVDFLIGGQSTTSAQFAITGIADDAPIATLSGSTGNGLVLDADNSTIQSLLNDTLTIGGASTGNIILSPLNSIAGSTVTPGADNLVSLGSSPSARFKDIFLGPSSAHIICTTGDGCGQGLDYALGVNTSTGTFSIGVNGATPTGNPLLSITQGGDVIIAGNLGVNISSGAPEALFEIEGAEGTDSVLVLNADNGDDTPDTWSIISQATGNDLSIQNNSVEVFNLTTGGNLQIDGTLTVNSTITEAGSAVLSAADINTCAEFIALVVSTGTCGSTVFSVNPTFTGTINGAALSLSGTITAATNETINGIDINAGVVSDVTTLDTGQGANELYDMNQNVLTTSAVTFTTLNTGQGANELYDMNQNVLTTSNVTFGNITGGTITENGSAVLSAADINTCAEFIALVVSTGTCGSTVFSAGPTFTGTINAAAITMTGTLAVNGDLITSDGDLTLNPSGDVIIPSGDSLGIGDTTPDFALDIYRNDTATTTQLNIEQDGTGDALLGFRLTGGQTWTIGIDNTDSDKFTIDNADGFGSPILSIDDNGDVGIGSTNTNARLHVAGEGTGNRALRVTNGDTVVDFDELGGSGNTNGLCIKNNSATVPGTLSACSSSIRYKTNVVDTSFGLDTVRALRPVEFDWIQEGGHDFGFIAEETEEVSKLFATYQDADKLIVEGVRYSKLVSVAIKGIQELDEIINLNDSGNIVIAPTVDNNFEVTRNGNVVDRVGVFAELVSAKIRVGILDAQVFTSETLTATTGTISNFTSNTITALSANISNITADTLAVASANIPSLTTQTAVFATENITIAGDSIRDFITRIVDARISENQIVIISPIIVEDNNVIAKLPSLDSEFIIKNSSNSAVATIDSEGNASFSGQLSAKSVQANDASIAGTLRAKNIIADNIEGLNINAATIAANYITNNITNIYTATESSIINNQSSIINASGSANFNNLFALTATFEQGLISYGSTSFYDVSVGNRLFVGSRLSLADNSINVLGGTLHLQSLKQGGISFIGGLVEIDQQGNLKVGGNAYFARDVEVKGKFSANIIAPIPGQDLIFEFPELNQNSLAASSIKFKTGTGSATLSINNRGDLSASGAGTFSKLNLSFVGEALALSDTEVIATGSAGTAQVNIYQEELTILNPLVTKNSLIYVTPKTSLINQNIYLLRQVPGESFTVGISESLNKTVPFNWIIIN